MIRFTKIWNIYRTKLISRQYVFIILVFCIKCSSLTCLAFRDFKNVFICQTDKKDYLVRVFVWLVVNILIGFKCIPWRKKEDNISLNVWSQIQLNYCAFYNAKKKCFCNFFGRICIECYFDGTFVDSAVKLSSYHPTFVWVWLFPLATELFSLHFLCFRCTAQLYLRPFHLLIKLKKNKNIFEFA